MDIVESFDAPIVERVGSEDISFPILPLPVLSAKVAAKAKQARRDRAKAMISDHKLVGQEKLLVLKDGEHFEIEHVEEFVNDLDGAAVAVRASLELAAKTPEESDKIIGHLRPYQMNKLALLVCGFATLQSFAPTQEPKKSADPLPVTPKGYGDE